VNTTEKVPQLVPVKINIMKTHLVNVLSVEKPVSLVMMLIIVMSVLKTEFTPQIVSALLELMIVVLLLVAHVMKLNVSLVKVKLIIVLNVLISESLSQSVIAHQVTMKKMMEDVNFV
jgi:hypothetical protein